MTVTHLWGLVRILLPRYVRKVLHILSKVRVMRLSTHGGYADSSNQLGIGVGPSTEFLVLPYTPPTGIATCAHIRCPMNITIRL
jgi:hypothetical protein